MLLRRLEITCAAMLLILCACNEDPAQPTPVIPGPFVSSVFQDAISEPVPIPSSGSTDANTVGNTVYVAFATGELGNARSVRLRNVTAGAGIGSEHSVVDGALDPVAITAEIGDTLELVRNGADGAVVTMRAAVPKKRAPRVVRVDPPKGRTDVALNSKIMVVFTEPIDPNSLTAAALRLSVSGESVAGQFEFTPGPAIAVRFVPATPLSANTEYIITIASTITDLAGDALEESLISSFTTVNASVAAGTVNARVNVTTTGDDIPGSYLATLFRAGAQPIPSNGSVTFTNVPLTTVVQEMTHFVILSELPAHCSVITANPKALPAVLVAGETVDINFTVSCDRAGETGTVTTQQLAFVRGNDIFAVNSDGTSEVRLVTGGHNEGPAWSPDGGQIAFASDRAGHWNVYTINADGSNLVRRTLSTPPNSHASKPAWSPDGRRLAYHGLCDGDSCIRVTTLDDDAPSLRLGQPRGYNTDPAWSPDGRSIAFVSDWSAFDFVFDIYVTNEDGSNIVQLTNSLGMWRDLHYYLHPTWSPDGRQIAFVYSTIVNTSDMRYRVAVMNADGTGLRDLAIVGDIPWVQIQDPGSIAWSPDGSRIAFSRVGCDLLAQRQCSSLRSIRYVALDGSGEGLIAANAHSPAWRR